MRYVRSIALFVAGIFVGTLVMQVRAQQNANTAHRINHVGIRVTDYQKSLDFYTKILGFKVAYAFPPNPDGSPSTTFLQVNKDTFIEMAAANAQQPAGLNHFGLYTEDASATVAKIRAAGGTANDPRSGGPSGSILSNVTDPDMIRIEVNQQGPTSMMGKAMAAWK